MKKIKFSLIAISMVVTFFSCKKDDVPAPPEPPSPKITAGVYILNEGTFNGNNTTLTYYDFKTSTPVTDIYKNVNGSSLGDTGNDLMIYGSKMYIVMNGSSYLEVADASTAKRIKKIDLEKGGKPIVPRNVVSYNNNVFVSSWDGTVTVIDTASLAIVKVINVGKNPEQMVVAGNKLFVCNSGGITPGYDSTVSVIDLNILNETSKMTVGTNPTAIASDNAGNIYVVCKGNYGNIAPQLIKVDINKNAIVKSSLISLDKIRYYKGSIYALGGYGFPFVQKISADNLALTSTNFIKDGTAVTTPYALNIDELTGDVYVGDAKDYQSSGAVFCFDNSGKLKFKFSTAPGLLPNTVAFFKK